MTGATLFGKRVILREAVLYRAIRSRVPTKAKDKSRHRPKNPNGKVGRVEITLTCGHVISRKISLLRNTRFRCVECSEQAERDRTTDAKGFASPH